MPPLTFQKANIPASANGYSLGPKPLDGSALMLRFVRLLRAGLPMLLAFVGVIVGAVGLFSIRQPKMYEASAVLRVERALTGGVVGADATQVLPVNDMEQVMATHLEMIQSDAILRTVANKYSLLQAENQLDGLSTAERARRLAAPVKLSSLKLVRPPNSYLIRISYRSADAQIAAHVVNEIADGYNALIAAQRSRTKEELAALIADQQNALKVKMEASNAGLMAYAKELEITDRQQGTSVLGARLAQLNAEYTTAEAESIRKEAVLNSLRNSNELGAAQASAGDDSLAKTLFRLNEVRQQFAATRTTFGAQHPEFRKVQDQIVELERQVREATLRIGSRATAEYEQSVGGERRLRAAFTDARSEMKLLNARMLEFEKLKHDADADRNAFESLEKLARESAINNSFRSSGIQIAQQALPPDRPVSPNIPLKLAIAFIGSLTTGVLGLLLLDSVKRTISNPEELGALTDVKVLGALPAASDVSPAVTRSDYDNIFSRNLNGKALVSRVQYLESVRSIQNMLSLSVDSRCAGSMLLTSSALGDGKSRTAANLAVAFARSNKRVLLVDGDICKSTLHDLFGIANSRGLSDVLTGLAQWKDVTVPLGIDGLTLLPAGPLNPYALDLMSPIIRGLLPQWKRDYDIVIVDGPPLLAPEAQQLAVAVDEVIVIARPNKTGSVELLRTLSALAMIAANVRGVILNGVRPNDSYGYWRPPVLALPAPETPAKSIEPNRA